MRRVGRSVLRSIAVVVAVCAVGATTVLMASVPQANAAEASQFNPGQIISDENFYAGGAMSTVAVQQFLDAQQRGCSAGAVCLNGYNQTTPTMAANRYCTGYNGVAGETAASIISRVGIACNVNPRVLLVLLQKEQSLVTSQAPSPRQFERATGFACPDTAPCDSSYGGFFYQVYYAARQFNVYKQFPASFNYLAGQWNTVLYHPNSACGSSRLLIQNQATAGLYNYTPYQPNGAALANLYGTGDACSSYGNRNFWRMWTDWFGSPTTPVGMPFGNLEVVQAANGGARVVAWAIDPDSTQPTAIDLYVDGRGYGSYLANRERPDVAAAHGLGSARGLDETLQLVNGERRICAYAINRFGPGANAPIGCATVRVTAGSTGLSGSPFGAIEAVRVNESVTSVVGWAVDPDSSQPTIVDIYVDGRGVGQFVADRERADLATHYPTVGTRHGLLASFTLPAGTHSVCAYAINRFGPGSSTLLSCSSVTVAAQQTGFSGSPFGSVDSITASGSTVRILGWGIDRDSSRPTAMDVYVNGRGYGSFLADRPRPDVGAAYPTFGPNHGLDVSIRLPDGVHEICVFAINVYGPGENVAVRCQSIRVGPAPTGLSGSPFGSFDTATSSAGALRITGWAIDPDSSRPTAMDVYVNGVGYGSFLADRPRSDVGAAYPVFGAAHGLDVTLSLARGRYDVCLYAINAFGPGSNVLVQCRSVAVG